MGKRRGRRTRSDEGGRRHNLDRGPTVKWPGLSGPSILTPEGRIEQDRAVSLNLARAEGPRAESAKLLWVSRISPLATVALLLVYMSVAM
jgi:hypothetical protein